jgi:TolB-like protein
MKKHIFILFISICGFHLSAFNQKTTVGILSFTQSKDIHETQTLTSIQDAVIHAFVKTKRFDILDRTSVEAWVNEKELQKSEDFLESDQTVDQNSSLGAEYLVSGNLSSLHIQEMILADSSIIYGAKLYINLKVINVESGETISSTTITPVAGNQLAAAYGIGAKTPEMAIAKALKDIEKQIDTFVAENFPLNITIAEITNINELLLAVGSYFGVKVKDKYKVVELSEMEIDGRKLTRKKEIGEIVVVQVESENFSICKIKKGGALILARFNAGARLKCVSID